MTKIKTLNMLNDYLFKAVMCHEKNRKMVVSVLHALTGIEKEKLFQATFIGGEEIPKLNLEQKKQSTDLTIRIDKKNIIIVELNQFGHVTNLFEKNTEYALSEIVRGTPINVEVYPKVILINIDNFNRFHTKKAILHFKSRDEEGHIETNLYHSIHLILANMRKFSYNEDEELKKFSKFLRQETTIDELRSEFKGDEVYMETIDTVEELTNNDDFAFYYDLEEKHAWEFAMAKIGAKKEAEEEVQKEIKSKIKKEVQKEKKQLKKEIEKEKSIEIAKKMLAKNKDVNEIHEFTDLSLEEIKNLIDAD